MFRRMCVVGLCVGLWACSAATPSEPRPPKTQPARLAQPSPTSLQVGRTALRAARSKEAERALQVALTDPNLRTEAQVAWAELELLRGNYEAATAELGELPAALGAEHRLLRATAMRALGKLAEAIAVLESDAGTRESVEGQLLLGELLLESGQLDSGRAALMKVIERYNDGTLAQQPTQLACVGRAAHLLHSPEDANTAFNESELLGPAELRTLLWRAELFLDHHDPGHAEEVITEALELAPEHPEALIWMARLQLEQALDFEGARALVDRALQTNPRLSAAHAVLASLALRDLQLQQAERHVNAALQVNPRDLVAHSLLGTARFLADDEAGFERIKRQVLELNPHYGRFYQIVGQYADWEHRYDEIVQLMREAIALDDDDARAHAQLGINLIRGGDDLAGVRALQRSFAKDPYNVRVFNTLELYENVIPRDYVQVDLAPFRWRFPKDERAVLERTLAPLLNTAWEKMRGYYDFTPTTPVGVELYAERENFAIRTSGLPRTAIQGVCFGRTLASMTPRHEQFNVAMTVWHELAHVFHIQMSKSRVPRWFTEGLAEYETLVERPEWRREQDAELFVALRDGRLPKLSAMNQAFTHAEDLGDVAVAYYASSQIVEMFAQRYGRTKLNEMLRLWARGLDSEAVLSQALGKSSAELDLEVRQYLEQRLQRYRGQLVPSERIGDPDALQQAARKASTKDAEVFVRLARLHMRAGNASQAMAAVNRALELEPAAPSALLLKAQWSLKQGNALLADALVAKLLEAKHDGYEVQVLRARIASARNQPADVAPALQRARQFDPASAEPLWGLLEFADTPAARLPLLSELARIEEHRSEVFTELSELLLAEGRVAEAVTAAQSAVYAGAESPPAHVALGQAQARAGRDAEARHAFESALVCPAPAEERSRAHLAYEGYLRSRGRVAEAEVQRQAAQQVLGESDGE